MKMLIIFLIIAFIAYSVRYNLIRLRKARHALEKWAAENSFTIISARLCWWPHGPFSFQIATHIPVYRVSAKDREGKRREGWVLCVPFSEEVKLRWKE